MKTDSRKSLSGDTDEGGGARFRQLFVAARLTPDEFMTEEDLRRMIMKLDIFNHIFCRNTLINDGGIAERQPTCTNGCVISLVLWTLMYKLNHWRQPS
jgi:hypothetical protein